ncbi:hypothetical protein DN38_2186 [Vibrio cholerae]|nr:hypothetical protein DN36_2798 [Vibrio cholerae]KFE15885.1 hypothetical protein DN38_2186 [Vibrio cholerae]
MEALTESALTESAPIKTKKAARLPHLSQPAMTIVCHGFGENIPTAQFSHHPWSRNK